MFGHFVEEVKIESLTQGKNQTRTAQRRKEPLEDILGHAASFASMASRRLLESSGQHCKIHTSKKFLTGNGGQYEPRTKQAMFEHCVA